MTDPLDHYFTDEQMVAVTRYASHPITRGLALIVLSRGAAARGAARRRRHVRPLLFASSAERYRAPDRGAARPRAAAATRGARALAIAAEGPLARRPSGKRRSGWSSIGDADFASNSFFPYMANGDFVLAALAWLHRRGARARR